MGDDYAEPEDEKEYESIDDVLLQEEQAAIEQIESIDRLVKDRTLLMERHLDEIEKQISDISNLLNLSQQHEPMNVDRQQRFLQTLSELQKQIQTIESGSFNDVVQLEKWRSVWVEILRLLRRMRFHGRS